ncbi:MAG: T9SS type A sorting domain-containing protein, partial [Candidatus Cloacimonetes bacterium]|nr:T9SS type A sorting domain-containing protein [Candidatus Cloacimonadota bacterium]
EDNLVEGVPGLKIYPNPVSDKIWIKAPAQGNWDISLYDIRGRKVHTLGNYMAKDPAEAIQIELGKHKLSSGLYILQASFEGKKQRHRIVLKN